MRKKLKSKLIRRRTPQVVKYAEHHDIVFDGLVSNVTTYVITNRSSRVLRMSEVHISWPVGMDALFNVLVAGTAVWSGEDLDSPTDITGGWVNTPDKRDIPKGDTDIDFLWGIGGASTGFTLEIVFDNGQSVYIEH